MISDVLGYLKKSRNERGKEVKEGMGLMIKAVREKYSSL